MLVVALIGILIFRRIAITELQVDSSTAHHNIVQLCRILFYFKLLEPSWLFRSDAEKRVRYPIQYLSRLSVSLAMASSEFGYTEN
jgi:hypothetical protein